MRPIVDRRSPQQLIAHALCGIGCCIQLIAVGVDQATEVHGFWGVA